MSTIPATQYAIQFTGKDEVFLNTAKPVDAIGPTQILLQVEACGICFSDTKLLHAFADHPRKSDVVAGLTADELAQIPSYRPNGEPTVPGHEPVVRVVAVGDQVTDYKLGERLLVQADWRHLPTAASNGAFGYNFEGALQEYVVVDERIVVHDGEEFMLRVGDEPTAAQVALVEPWSTVEASYSRSERDTLAAGGRLLVVVDAGVTPSGLEPLLAAARPGSIVVVGTEPAAVDPEAVAMVLDEVEHGLDDIVYFGSDAATIERLSTLLGARSLLCLVLGGATIDRRVSLDVGRVHYDFTRYIGTVGSDPAEAYTHVPANGEIRAQDSVAIIGAAGPMGLMHTVRTVSLGLPGVRVVGADVNDERLAHLASVVNPTAVERGVPFEVVNSSTAPLAPGFSYLTCLVPVPALLSQAVDLAGEGAIVNAFAGFPAGTLAELDLQGIIERHVFLIGTSGSEMSDMRTLLTKLETRALDTSISLDAVCGMAGFSDAIDAVNNRTSGGKIMVYPGLHDLGLVRLSEMAEKLPEVAAALDDGRWTKAAEAALLATAG